MEREQTMTDNAAVVRGYIAEWAGSLGLHGEMIALAALDALVAERDEARRLAAARTRANIDSRMEAVLLRAEAAEAKLAEWKQAADAEAFAGDEARTDNARLREELREVQEWVTSFQTDTPCAAKKILDLFTTISQDDFEASSDGQEELLSMRRQVEGSVAALVDQADRDRCSAKQTWEKNDLLGVRLKRAEQELAEAKAKMDKLIHSVKHDTIPNSTIHQRRAEAAEAERDEARELSQALRVELDNEWIKRVAAETDNTRLREALAETLARPRYLSIGSIDNTVQLRRLNRAKYDSLLALADKEGT